MNEPTPIVFYAPSSVATLSADGEVDTEAILKTIGATDIVHRHADLHGAQWSGMEIIASAQITDSLVRLVLEFASMEWIDMRLCNPDNSLIHPERTRQLIDEFAAAADALDCEIAFKSMTVLPDGWANWDVFLPDFDRVAAHRSARDLVREMVDFGYASNTLDGIEWDADDAGLVLDTTPGLSTDKGTVWFGERMPALT